MSLFRRIKQPFKSKVFIYLVPCAIKATPSKTDLRLDIPLFSCFFEPIPRFCHVGINPSP